MSDFNGTDYDFAVGSVLGLRSWDIDEQGRLHGITHREVWRPGENMSVCKKMREIPCPNPPQPKPSVPRDHLPATASPTPKPKKKGRNRRYSDVLAPWERELLYGPMQGPIGRCDDPACYGGHHVVGSDHRFDPNCDCGFWAYDDRGFTAHGSVSGIIEGYGKTTIGTRGFRSEKARIVALSRERGERRPLALSTWLRLQQIYPGVEFYENTDAMTLAHPSVLKEWGPVGEDFWDKPVSLPDDGMGLTFQGMRASLSRMNAALARSYYVPPVSSWTVGS